MLAFPRSRRIFPVIAGNAPGNKKTTQSKMPQTKGFSTEIMKSVETSLA
jgi:hypothetical protein